MKEHDDPLLNIWREKKERRQGPDFLLKSLTWINATGWILVLFSFFLLYKAKPVTETFLDKQLHVSVRERFDWDMALLGQVCACMVLCMILSGAGLYINSLRHKRRFDTYRLSLILLGILATVFVLGFCIVWLIGFISA